MTMIPHEIFEPFIKKLLKHSARSVRLIHDETTGAYKTKCRPEIFPTIYFLLQDHWVEMYPSDYIIKATSDEEYNNAEDICYLAMAPSTNSEQSFILGDSFMRGFYTIFADESNLIGIVPHVTSIKRSPWFEANPPHSRHINATGVADLTATELEEVSGGIFSLFVIAYVIY